MTIATAIFLLVATATSSNSGLLVAAQAPPRPAPTSSGAADDGAAAAATNTLRQQPTTCPQMPSLHCQNGSTCEEGIANFGKQHDHLDLQTHESGWYCKCINGYIGHECEIAVDDCDGDTGYNPSDPTGILVGSCYHGAKCKRTNNAQFYCDCDQLNRDSGAMATKFAGLMCQHESTSLCAATLAEGNGAAPNLQFCTNHGKCVKMVEGDDAHPGCVCNPGWAGDRCEIRENTLKEIAEMRHADNKNSSEGGNPIAGKILFSLLIIAMGMVSTGIIVMLMKAKRQSDGGGGDGSAGAAAAATTTGGDPAKTVLGQGDLEPDGSGTLGTPSPNENDDDDADGDMELTSTEENTASSEPEIV